MRTITSVLLLFGFTLLAQAQQRVRYLVELQTAPVFAPAQRISSAAVLPASPRLSIRLDNESALPAGARMALADDAEPAAIAGRPSPQEQALRLALVQTEQANFDTHAAASGFKSIRHIAHVANIVVVEGAPHSEAALSALPGVKRVARERIYHSNFDASIALHQIDSAWAAIPGATYNRANPSAGVWNPAGQGVKIGIIDTGIDPTHPAFQVGTHMSAPADFPKYNYGYADGTGTANNQSLTGGKIIVARSYGGQLAQDVDGHGTAVAQLAAGVFIPSGVTQSANGPLASPNGMTLSGVAPAAWLGIYDVDSQLDGSYADPDILAALEDCALDGMDVISMSFGAPDYGGSLDPLNLEYDTAFDSLKNIGTVMVASAGNDGPDSNTIAAPAVDPDVIAAGAQQSKSLLFSMTVPSAVSPYLSTGASVTASGTTYPASAADNDTAVVPALALPLVDVTTWDSTGLGCTNGSAWPQAGVAAGKILIVERGSCNFTVKVDNAITAGAKALIIYNAAAPSDGAPDNLYPNGYPIGLDSDVSPSAIANFPTLFIGHDDGETLRTNLQNAGGVYNVTATFGLVTGDTSQIADFSSRGPDADLTIRPQLVAAGNSIVTAYCTDTNFESTYNSCSVFGYYFWDGTSFASPLTAGAIALIKSARPNLDADDYRSLVVNTASPMLDPGGNTWPIQTAGAGSLNVVQGLQSTVTANPVTLSFGVARQLPSFPASQQITLKNVGSSTTTYNLTYEGMSGLAPSSQAVVAVTVSWGAGSATLLFPAYNAAATSVYTSELPVTPKLSVNSLTLAPRATANVTVTMPTAGLAAGTAYQGFIDVTPTGASTPHARIPYWYAVPAAAPTQIAFDLTPLDISVSSGGTGTIILRFVDNNGVVFPAPGGVNVPPVVTETANGPYGPAIYGFYDQNTSTLTPGPPYQATSADGSVTFRNVWLLDIEVPNLDPGGTTYTFHVQSGSVSGTFTVVSSQ